VPGPLIAIVGAGPVGALSALELSRCGLDVVLLEARTEIAWTSRAICISRRSLEILDRAGVGEAFASKGLPWSKGKTFHRDKLVFRLDLPHGPDDRHAPFINLQQCFTEQFLIDALKERANVDLRWGHRVTTVTQSNDCVTVETEDRGECYSLRASWLVAADGARSVVRTSLGLSMKGTSYEGRYLISDIEVEGASWPVERHVWFDAPANPGSTVILHVQPDGIWRIDMQLHEHEDPEQALRDENLLPRLQAQLDMIGVTAQWRLVWKSVYRAHSLSLDSYRHGRVLFAGDAAHLVPIFGVRGLNSGFDDAHNLAWKLAMVARGEAPEELLDSYSAERRRATAENIANADKSTWFMSPPTEGFRRMRDAALTLAHEEEWARSLINPRQASSHVYDGSPVIVQDDLPQKGVRPGAHVPNIPFGASCLQLALPSTGFSALLFVSSLPAASVDELCRQCELLHVAPVLIGADEVAIAQRFASDIFPVYLVRPDEHVAARLRADETDRLEQGYRVAIGHGGKVDDSERDIRAASTIEDIYECISTALDRADAASDETALERIALSLANHIGDARIVNALVERALEAASDESKREL
jgi:3-(3-hydroxy-phenyl)propionate hydroxylase